MARRPIGYGENDELAHKVRERLVYIPSTGRLIWVKATANRIAVGDDAGSLSDGYIEVGIDGCVVKAHRIAWLLYYGHWPIGTIDHINGDRTDNRISNLRLASHKENARNTRRHCDNASGFKGVIKHKMRKKPWQARIYINGKNKSLGYYNTAEDAHAAYMKAAHENFGKFARSA